MKSLHGGSVVVQASRFEIDLNALAARTDFAQRMSQQTSEGTPPVSLPGLAAVVVQTGGLSLRALLGAADSGTAMVRIPLVPQTIKVGPLAVEIEGGSRIVLELVVTPGGVIERAKTRGRLEPGLKLPLGVVVQGVYVDPAGNIVANVERFPDVNLSLLALRGLRLPESLGALLAFIFDAPKAEKKGDAAQPAFLDLAAIEVEATDVVACAGPISLGAGVVLSSGDKTRLDISWAGRQLRIAGVVDVVSADVQQPAVALGGLSGQARVDFSMGIDSGALQLSIEDAAVRVSTVKATIGDSVIVIEEAGTQQPARAHIERTSAQSDGKAAPGKLRFQIEVPSLDARVREGVVVVDVGNRRVPINVQPGHASGSLVVSERHHKVDLKLVDVGLAVDDVAIDTPLGSLHVQGAQAHATGRLVAATDLGLAFSGGLLVEAVLDDAVVNAGVVSARGQGKAQVNVAEVAVSSHGLELLVLQGSLNLALNSGRVPLFSTSLELLPGATAAIDLHRVVLQADTAPQAEGAVIVEATAALCVVDEALLVVPASSCRLAVPRFVVGAGLLVAENLHASVRTS